MKFVSKAGNLVILGVVTACAAPAITLNVWPRLENMREMGVTSNELGIALLVTVSALGMTAIPFAMKKAENWGFWSVCLGFGLILAVFNYVMAVGAIGKVTDYATSAKSEIISRAATLREQIKELKAARKQLGSFRPTSEEMLRAADDAVRLATEARDRECEKVGDFCRARVAQLQSRLAERAEQAASRALTIEAGRLDGDRTARENQLGALGEIPRDTNAQAGRIARLLSRVSTLEPAAVESVADGIIHFTAILAEVFALVMPRVVVTALAKPAVLLPVSPALPPAPLPLKTLNSVPRQRNGAATAIPPRSAAAIGPVAAWKTEALHPGSSRLICWDVYQRYVKWCKARYAAPASFTQFDFELCELGVKKVNEGRGSFYAEVEL